MPIDMTAVGLIQKNKLNNADPFLLLVRIQYEAVLDAFFVYNNENITYPTTAGATGSYPTSLADIGMDKVWTAIGFSLGAIEENKEGEIPETHLSIVDYNRLMIPTIEAYDGLIGATVNLYVKHANDLNNKAVDIEIPFEIIGTNILANFAVQFTLGAENLLNSRFPAARYMKNYCRFKYMEEWHLYPGEEASADGAGGRCQAVDSSGVCDGSYAHCVLKDNATRYGGFIGIPTGGIYV